MGLWKRFDLVMAGVEYLSVACIGESIAAYCIDVSSESLSKSHRDVILNTHTGQLRTTINTRYA